MKKKIFNREFHELTGAVHIHTEYSHDCSIPLSEVIKQAKKNRLDYIMITDHNNYDFMNDPAYINEKDLIIVPGIEINDSRDKNHYLQFVEPGLDIKEKGGYSDNGFAAHPLEKRICSEYPTYEWDKDFDFTAGIEVWNFVSCWLSTLHPFVTGAYHMLFPAICANKPLKKTLKLWDDLNIKGCKTVGIGSVDAHTHSYKLGFINLKVLPHYYLFKTVRTNVLIPLDKEVNKDSVKQALRNGNSYIVNYKSAYPEKFYGGITAKNGTSAIYGEKIEYSEGMVYYFMTKRITRVKLIKDGACINQKIDDKGKFEINGPGIYRLEIKRWGSGWIYTNPIYVFS